MNDLCIENAQLPTNTGEVAAINIKDGVIVSIGEPEEAHQRIDAEGRLAFPGAFDPHVHFREPDVGREDNPKETWNTAVRAALKGGVTHVIDMPNNNPPITTFERLREKFDLIGEQPIGYDLLLAAAVDDDRVNDLEIVASKDRILGVKMWMGASTGNILVEKREHQKLVMKTCAELDLICFCHAEDEATMAARRNEILRSGRHPLVCDHCFIRDPGAEVIAVDQALELQREIHERENRRVRLYFCHISTPEAIRMISSQRKAGYVCNIEVCPHHLFLDRSYLTRDDGFNFKMNPPLRSTDQVQGLLKCLLEGVVDTVGSDHAPHRPDEKRAGKYDKIPSGIPGVQTMVPLIYKLIADEGMTVEHFKALTSGNANRIFGYEMRGDIRVGFEADLYLIDADPQKQEAITDEEQESLSGYSAFSGVMVHKVHTTIVGGEVRYREGEFFI